MANVTRGKKVSFDPNVLAKLEYDQASIDFMEVLLDLAPRYSLNRSKTGLGKVTLGTVSRKSQKDFLHVGNAPWCFENFEDRKAVWEIVWTWAPRWIQVADATPAVDSAWHGPEVAPRALS